MNEQMKDILMNLTSARDILNGIKRDDKPMAVRRYLLDVDIRINSILYEIAETLDIEVY